MNYNVEEYTDFDIYYNDLSLNHMEGLSDEVKKILLSHQYCIGTVNYPNSNKVRYKGVICDNRFVVGKGTEYNEDGSIAFCGQFETKEELAIQASKGDYNYLKNYSNKKNGHFYKNGKVFYIGIPRKITMGNCRAGINPYSFPYSYYTGFVIKDLEISEIYLEGKQIYSNEEIFKVLQSIKQHIPTKMLLKILNLRKDLQVFYNSRIEVLDLNYRIKSFTMTPNSYLNFEDELVDPPFIGHKCGDIVDKCIILNVDNSNVIQ